MSGATTTTRKRRGFRPDARAIIGIVLVIASVLGVLAVLTFARHTDVMLRATENLVVGEPLDTSKLEPVEVDLGQGRDAYLKQDEVPAEGAVLTRPISAGELIPRDALGAPDTDSATVVVSVDSGLPESATVGSFVEVWASSSSSRNTGEPPVVLVQQARILRITDDSSVVSGMGNTRVELRVPRENVAAVLGSVGNGARISIVPIYASAV